MMKTPSSPSKNPIFCFISYNKIKECFNLNLRFSIYRFHGRFHGCVIDRFYGRFGFGPKPRLKTETEPNRPFTSLSLPTEQMPNWWISSRWLPPESSDDDNEGEDDLINDNKNDPRPPPPPPPPPPSAPSAIAT